MSKAICAQPRSKNRTDTRRIAVCALLCALNVLFARFFTAMPTAVARFSVEAVPVVLAGYFFGPISGMMVGFIGDMVGCLFSPFGWDPLISLSPMLVGLFGGLLRPLVRQARSFRDIWRVALTLLPAKLLGSVYWTSQCLVWLGYSKKGLGLLMGTRAIEAGVELLLDTLVVTLLISTGMFARARLLPYEKSRSANPLHLTAGILLIVQVAVLVVGSLTLGLGFMNADLSVWTRIGSAALYFIPAILSLIVLTISLIRNRGKKNDDK